jgi:GMP synthase (glutamine-hydrolysing)
LLLVVDNGSVYTPSLLDSITNLNIDFEYHVFSNISSLNLDNYSSVILSGRRKNDSQMNIINSKLVKHSIENDKPLLGICYGAEILALTLGGTIKKMSSSRYGLHEIEIVKSNPLCEGKIKGFESHSYMVSKVNTLFTQIASSTDCKFEIFQYDDKNIFGTQFHPEMSSDGKALLEKFSSIK